MNLLSDDRLLTDVDHARLAALLERAFGVSGVSGPHGRERHDPALQALAELLSLGDPVPSEQVDADVVTMRSRLVLQEAGAAAHRTITLAYPGDEDPTGDKVSVMCPLGAALLGVRVGGELAWQGPTGERHHARVAALLYQPEAAGDWRR